MIVNHMMKAIIPHLITLVAYKNTIENCNACKLAPTIYEIDTNLLLFIFYLSLIHHNSQVIFNPQVGIDKTSSVA